MVVPDLPDQDRNKLFHIFPFGGRWSFQRKCVVFGHGTDFCQLVSEQESYILERQRLAAWMVVGQDLAGQKGNWDVAEIDTIRGSHAPQQYRPVRVDQIGNLNLECSNLMLDGFKHLSHTSSRG